MTTDAAAGTTLDPRLDPGLAALLTAIAGANLPPPGVGTPEAARTAFRGMTCDIRPTELVVPVAGVENGELPGPAGPSRSAPTGPRPRPARPSRRSSSCTAAAG